MNKPMFEANDYRRYTIAIKTTGKRFVYFCSIDDGPFKRIHSAIALLRLQRGAFSSSK